MGNCKITKLIDSVDNENLLDYGSFKINRKSSDSYDAAKAYVIFRASANFTVTTKGDGYMAESAEGLSDPELRFTSFDIAANYSKTLYFSNGDYPVHISAKYTFTRLSTDTSSDSLFEVDLNDFAFDSSVTSVDFRNSNAKVSGDLLSFKDSSIATLIIAGLLDIDAVNSNVSGDISNLDSAKEIVLVGQSEVYGDISSLSNAVEIINVTHTNVEGTAQDLGGFASLKRFFIGNTNITGSVEELVDTLVDNGRTTSGTDIFCYGVLSQLSFGGNIREPNGYKNAHRLEFDGTRTPYKITIKGPTTGKKWYVSGWTQEEIEEYEAQDYIIINCSS